jgi:hypothetical protein
LKKDRCKLGTRFVRGLSSLKTLGEKKVRIRKARKGGTHLCWRIDPQYGSSGNTGSSRRRVAQKGGLTVSQDWGWSLEEMASGQIGQDATGF